MGAVLYYLGLALYYCSALLAGASLGTLLAVVTEPLLDHAQQKSVRTRWGILGGMIAVAASIVLIVGVISSMRPSGPGAMPGVGFAILVMVILPMSVIGAAILGAVTLFLRVPSRALSITIVVASAIAWGVAGIHTWIRLDKLMQTLTGIGLFALAPLDASSGFHTMCAAVLMSLAAILVLSFGRVRRDAPVS